MLSEEESQDRFEDADENEDGKVTWAEYISDTYGIQSGEEENNIIDEEGGEDKVSYIVLRDKNKN